VIGGKISGKQREQHSLPSHVKLGDEHFAVFFRGTARTTSAPYISGRDAGTNSLTVSNMIRLSSEWIALKFPYKSKQMVQSKQQPKLPNAASNNMSINSVTRGVTSSSSTSFSTTTSSSVTNLCVAANSDRLALFPALCPTHGTPAPTRPSPPLA
jgi:hypothetical protein